MKINDLLVERVLNAFDKESKEAYAKEVWDMLQKAYASIGGFGSASSPEELINDSGLWKMVKRNGAITAVNIYKDKFGRKAIASATDGSVQGKRDYFMITKDDVNLKRSWAEVSGSPEKIMARMDATPIPAKFAAMLTGTELLHFNDDGSHYTRLIAGHPHEKIIYGTVNLDQNSLDRLKKMGVKIEELPPGFKIPD